MNRALQVMVFFSGDAMLRTSKGVRFIGESYGARSPASIEADMAQWSVQAGVPAIFLARPGLNGSSGDHNMRRRVREIDLMDAALDRLKERHGISSFILVGQSGGGHLVASLLNRRSDISAAVISSGLLSVKRYMSYWARVENLPEWGPFSSKELYDPVEEVDRIAWEPTPRIFIISDPDDRLVPFFTQLHYVRRLRAAGFEPQHVYAHAADRKRHHLFEHGRRAAALLAQGKSDRAIRRELHEMDLEHLE